MKMSTYHLHTTFSDGENTAEEMILEAIARKCPEIGFSDHAPLPFKETWAMDEDAVPEYVKALEELREKYKDKIKVYIGIEQDYYSPELKWKPDYIIGSVHYIKHGDDYLPLDLSPSATRENIEKYYDGDACAYCEDYYALVADVYNKTKCDIIGHFDLIIKFNEKLPLIDTSAPRYIEAENKALKALLNTPAHFEVNTGAITRGYRTKPYPSEEVIKLISDNGGSLVLNTDTHSTFSLDMHLDAYARIFDKVGISYIKSLDEIL